MASATGVPRTWPNQRMAALPSMRMTSDCTLSLAPALGNDVMVIELFVLRDQSSHPIPGPLKNQEIEDSVVDRVTL